ncbi:MAG TPA: hypothetical protein DCQ94_09890 [Nitrospira sp.]|nr:hypothetical protein [Nitrospira sp.]
MNDTQYEYLLKMMEAMIEKQFLPPYMDPADKALFEAELSRKANNLKIQFLKDWKKYRDEEISKEDRQKIEKKLENLAKALPGVTKGTLSAITAFKNGDAISGSAAIMDICASLAPLLAGLSAAGGPPGMLVGAIFSMVGQILSFFAPQSESLTSKIEKLLRDLKAEETQQDITTVHQAIRVYASSLRQAARRAAAAMGGDKPLLDLMVTDEIIKAINPLEGNTVTLFRGVTNWLNEPKNQTLDLWPAILSAACQAWADMMAAALTLLSFVHTDEVENRYETAKKLTDPKETRRAEKALMKLQAHVIARLVIFKADNDLLLEILQELVPAAQNRGMFWMIGENARTYAGTHIKQGVFENLGGEGKSISAVVPRKDIGSPRPTYYHVGLESWGTPGYDRTYISEIKPPYTSQDSKQLVDENGKDDPFRGLSDIWAEPGDQLNNIRLYTAKGKAITGCGVDVEKGMNKARGTGYAQTLKADVKSVRVLHHPQAFLNDPDNTPGILTGADYCVYGGLARENSEIYVDIGKGKSGYVPSPWGGYDGLGVDRHYLWVFGSGSFACATHASIMRCLKGEINRPRWMEHWPKDILYTQEYNRDKNKVLGEEKPLKGLVDVCPCDDGTLVAALYKRTVTLTYPSLPSNYPLHSFGDINALYTAAYHTDLKNKTIRVDWTKIEVSTGIRVHKLPVFCWSLFESLPAMLDRLAPELAAL